MALRVEGGRRYGAMNAAARGISEMVLGCLGTVRRVGRKEKERERERERKRGRGRGDGTTSVEAREEREFSYSKGVPGAQDCSEGCCIIYGRHRSSSGERRTASRTPH